MCDVKYVISRPIRVFRKNPEKSLTLDEPVSWCPSSPRASSSVPLIGRHDLGVVLSGKSEMLKRDSRGSRQNASFERAVISVTASQEQKVNGGCRANQPEGSPFLVVVNERKYPTRKLLVSDLLPQCSGRAPFARVIILISPKSFHVIAYPRQPDRGTPGITYASNRG
jgi:hypothetical protein